MDKPKTTPKDFFMWAGAMVAFYWSITSFLGLVFDYINYAFPESSTFGSYYYSNPYESGISYEMASLIVLFPLFIVLMRFIHSDILKDATRSEIWVRRWAIFLTLFIAGATMAGDLIWLLTSFLNGSDLTVQFITKAALVFLVAAAAFMHFMAEFWGYWGKYPSRGHMVGYAAGALVLLTVISGFFIVGTPMQARQMRLDVDKINDLAQIQAQIVSQWQTKRALPQTLAGINDPLYGFSVPMDAQTKQPYEYTVTGPLSFQLCATFNAASNGASQVAPTYVDRNSVTGSNWQHTQGHSCFDRTIDPTKYPPTKAQ